MKIDFEKNLFSSYNSNKVIWVKAVRKQQIAILESSSKVSLKGLSFAKSLIVIRKYSLYLYIRRIFLSSLIEKFFKKKGKTQDNVVRVLFAYTASRTVNSAPFVIAKD